MDAGMSARGKTQQPDQQQAGKGQAVVEIFPEDLLFSAQRQQGARELASAADGKEATILK